jgi:hypothetical protein
MEASQDEKKDIINEPITNDTNNEPTDRAKGSVNTTGDGVIIVGQDANLGGTIVGQVGQGGNVAGQGATIVGQGATITGSNNNSSTNTSITNSTVTLLTITEKQSEYAGELYEQIKNKNEEISKKNQIDEVWQTRSWHRSLRDNIAIPKDVINEAVKILEEKWLIVIGTDSSEWGYSAVNEIISEIGISSDKLLTVQQSSRNDFSTLSINNICSIKKESESKDIIIIDAISGKDGLLNSLLCGIEHSDYINDILFKKLRYCICIVSNRKIKEIQNDNSKLEFPYAEVKSIKQQDISQKFDILSVYDRDEYTRSALFVVTFFSRLNPDEFSRLSMILCKSYLPTHSPNIEINSTRQNDSSSQNNSPSQNDSPKRELTDNEKHARLHSVLDALVRERVLSLTTADGGKVIQFASLEQQHTLEQTLLHERYFEFTNAFHILIGSGVLFDRSSQISGGAVGMVATAIQEDPSEEKWHLWFKEQVNLQINIDAKDEKKQRDFISAKILNLFNALFLNDEITFIVDQLFDSLHSVSKPIAFRLAFNLYRVSFEKALKWMQNCINQANAEDRRDLLSIMLTHLSMSDFDAPVFLDAVYQWVPERSVAISRYSEVNKFAFMILLIFVQVSIAEIKSIRQNGDTTSHLQMLESDFFFGFIRWDTVDSVTTSTDTVKADSAINEIHYNRIKLLISALFHPGIISILEEEADVDGNFITPVQLHAYILFAFFLPEIFWSISYIKQSNSYSDLANKIEKEFIEQIQMYIGGSDIFSRQRKQINLDCWRQISNNFLEESTEFQKRGKKNEAIRFMRMREHLQKSLQGIIEPSNVEKIRFREKELLEFLKRLAPADFDQILLRITIESGTRAVPLNNSISEGVPHIQRVNELFRLVQSSSKPEMVTLFEAVEKLFPEQYKRFLEKFNNENGAI